MSKHSPGPWHINAELPCLIQSKNRDIASTAHYGAHAHSKGLESQETKTANALLIAASPELLSALQMLVVSIENCAKAKDDQTKLYQLSNADKWTAMRNAKAAIAKAKGGGK